MRWFLQDSTISSSLRIAGEEFDAGTKALRTIKGFYVDASESSSGS
jgi:hypothetical protein